MRHPLNDLIDRASTKHDHHGPGDYPHERYPDYDYCSDICHDTLPILKYQYMTDVEKDYVLSRVRLMKPIDIAYYFGGLGFGLSTFVAMNRNKLKLLSEDL